VNNGLGIAYDAGSSLEPRQLGRFLVGDDAKNAAFANDFDWHSAFEGLIQD
jgi:hypothetical protein